MITVSESCRVKTIPFLLVFAYLLMISGCSSSTPSISVALNIGTSMNAIAGQVVNVTATVTNDSKNAGVIWSLSPASGSGTLSNQTATSVTYTAPSPIASNTTVTLTATSATDSTKTAYVKITLQAVSIALSPSAAQTDEQGQTTTVTATVSYDPDTMGVTWSLSAGAKGTLSGQTATSVTYHAPAAIAAASTDTITATSAFDNTKTLTLTINLVPPPSVTTASLSAGTVGTAYSATLAATNGVAPYSWSVTVGALPAGLTLSATGTISGTPTAYGTSSFTVQVKDADGFTATAALSLKINPAPVGITTTSLPNGIVSSAYSATLQSTGGATPITWTVTVGALPNGLTLAANGAITGTPTSAGTANFTVQAADSSTPALTATKPLSITVIPVLSITTTSLANGITGTAYSATLQSTGGVAPVTWSVTVGTLPAGLSLNVSTGAITGTPTTAGTSGFTVQAADSGTPQQKVPKALSITIVQALVINNTSLPTGAVSSTYNAALTSSGGTPPVTWSVSVGTLPAGLTLNTATGAITGTPTTAGMSTFTVQAADSGTPQQTPTKQFSIVINPVLAITTTSLPSGTVGTAYNQTLQSNNGGVPPLTWSVILGSLPPGLTLNAGTGAISGTPTSATGSPFNFTVQAADSGTPQQTAQQALSISIANAPLSIVTSSLPNGVVGQAYSATLTSAGGNPPVTWSISSGSLPSWATLNANTGAITGTPNAAATTSFTVKATDSSTPTAQTATKALSITVVTALAITTTSLPAGTVGSAYSMTVVATGGTTPYTWSWAAQSGSSLPPGLNITPSSGLISGTPTADGSFNVTVTVTDSTNPQQNASANFTITIAVATLTITTSSLPNGTVSTSYDQQLNFSGGTPPVTWTITMGALPSGLTLSPGGAISGTPTGTGTSNFTVKATDSGTPTPQTATASLSITVNEASTCVSGGSESLLNGGYAFVLKGFDSSGNPVLIGGVLTFNGTDNNGLITAGAVDMNLDAGVQTNLNVTSGSYGVGSDQRGCMVITTSFGTQNFRFALGNISSGVASTGHVIDFDSTGPFVSGVMRKQTGGPFSKTSVNGTFAFGAGSAQNAANGGGKAGVVGVITYNGNGGINGGSEDINQNGVLDGNSTLTTWPATSPITFNSTGSSYTMGSNGRGTLTITIVGVSGTLDSVLYAVSSTDALFMTSDPQASNSIVAGEALQQSGTPFAANPLSGSYVGYDSGLGSTGGGRTDIFLVGPMTSGNSTLALTQYRNDGGTFQSSSGSGTYSVSSAGRMLATGTGNHAPILYLVSTSQVFELNSDGGVEAGFFQSQSGSPFSNSTASGTYAFGVIDPESPSTNVNSGVAVFTPGSPTGTINITQDSNGNGSQNLGQTQTLSYSINSTGLGMIPSSGSSCTITTSSTTCQTLFYIISPSKAVVMDTTSSNPKNTLADK